MQCIVMQAFDSEVFGLDFYRIKNFNVQKVSRELKEIFKHEKFFIDAKIPSYKKNLDIFLQRWGFRKVCMQVELQCNLNFVPLRDSSVEITDTFMPHGKIINQHAANFSLDRLSLDGMIEEAKRIKFYKEWIHNSFRNSSIKVAHIGDNFCSFYEHRNILKIDLISVLDTRKGIGSKLLNTLLFYAKNNGYKAVCVVTECENYPAFKMYQKCGFEVSSFYSRFHLIK